MKALLSTAIMLTAVALAGCTVHQTEAPGLTGPSDLALSMRLTALPDTINQDGGSQSSIQVTAFGPDGKPKGGLPLRMDIMVEGKPQDYGTLSGRTIVTNSSGVASVIYTAPPSPPPPGNSSTCQSLPGRCVEIVATPSGTGFETANPQRVTIRLVPIGVIQPSDGPVPDFTFTPTTPGANTPVQFDASASCGGPLTSGVCPGTSGIVQYSWNFGDGSTATGRTASHSFASQLSYTVILKITNDLGISVPKSKVVTVGAGAVPTVDFVFSPTAPVVNQPVNFDASQARAGAGHSIASYSWNFGDGSSTSGVTATHDFSTVGTFNVVLTVTDETGQATTVAKGVTVATGGGTGGGGATTASFVASPTAPVVGQVVFFNASGSSAATGHTLTKYAWDFGDGTAFAGSTSSATHTFTTVGTFTVGLIVTDDTGQTAKFAGSVTVAAAGIVAPAARFTSSPAGPGVNQDVFFNASSSTAAPGHTLITYAWDFGDGSSGSGVTVTHAYARAGSFTVTLVVTDDVAQTGTVSSGVNVVANSSQIVADFVFSPTDPKIGIGTNQVFFDATASSSPSGITTYVWDFGDGSVAGAGQKPNHTYALPATYVVRLTVTDGTGRTATTTKTVTVAP